MHTEIEYIILNIGAVRLVFHVYSDLRMTADRTQSKEQTQCNRVHTVAINHLFENNRLTCSRKQRHTDVDKNNICHLNSIQCSITNTSRPD